MKITVNGKIVAVLEKKSGIAKSGKEWMTQAYLIEEEESKELLQFSVFGADNITNYGLTVGSVVSAVLNLKSREYNGKYFYDCQAVQCYVKPSANTAPAAPVAPEVPASPTPTASAPSAPKDGVDVDDLPF